MKKSININMKSWHQSKRQWKTNGMIFIWPKAIINRSCDLLKPFSKHWQEVIKTQRRLLRAERRGEHVVAREMLLMLLRRVISRSRMSAALLFQAMAAVHSWIIYDAWEKKMSLESQINKAVGGLKVIWERRKGRGCRRPHSHLFSSSDVRHCRCWLLFFLLFFRWRFWKEMGDMYSTTSTEATENEHFICGMCASTSII